MCSRRASCVFGFSFGTDAFDLLLPISAVTKRTLVLLGSGQFVNLESITVPISDGMFQRWHGVAVNVQVTPRTDVVQRSSRFSARVHTEYASPRDFVPRTRDRQFARAFVLANHSKEAGSPRADTGDAAQVPAADAGEYVVDSAMAVATSREVMRGDIRFPATLKLHDQVQRAVSRRAFQEVDLVKTFANVTSHPARRRDFTPKPFVTNK